MTSASRRAPELRVGFIGLGDIGLPMARCLQRAGFPLAIYNRTASKADALVEGGARLADTPRALLLESDVVITCLATAAADRTIYEGPSGLLGGRCDGVVIVNTGTIGPDEAKRLAAATIAVGGDYLDCPLMGGNAAAVGCALNLAVGGSVDAFERAKPALSALAERVERVGEVGLPQVVKLANNLIYALCAVALADVVRLTGHLGVPPDLLGMMLPLGSARGYVMDANLHAMLTGTVTSRGTVGLLAKDTTLVADLARAAGVRAPTAVFAAALYARAVEAGAGGLDPAALVSLALD